LYPNVVQFETRQMELEARMGLYGEREARARRAPAETDVNGHRPRAARRLLAFLRPARLSPEPSEC
jgi:hypothetical protein